MFIGVSPTNISKSKMVGGSSGPAVETDPYFANVVSLLHFDTGNTTITDVIAGKTWTAVGNASANGTAKFGSYALAMDGAGDRIYTTDTSLRGTTKTYEFWLYKTGTNDPYMLISYGGSWAWNTTNGIEFFLSYERAFQRINFYFNVSGVYAGVSTRNGSAIENQWQHIAVVLNAAGTDKVQVFIDGVLEARSTQAVTPISSWSGFYISDAPGAAGAINGRVDDFRCTSVARYVGTNVGDTVFSVPTAAFPDS